MINVHFYVIKHTDCRARYYDLTFLFSSRRFDFLKFTRRVIEDDWDDADDLEDDDKQGEEMEVTEGKAKKSYKPGRYYRNQVE